MPKMNSNHGEVTDDRKLSGINVSERIGRLMSRNAQSSIVRGAFGKIFDCGKLAITSTEPKPAAIKAPFRVH
jgi:hypothetical protein